jgi:hypothetical protein
LCPCWNHAFWTAIYFDTMTGLTSLWHSSVPWKENNTELLIENKNTRIHPQFIYMCSSPESSEVIKLSLQNILDTCHLFTSDDLWYIALRILIIF